MCLAGPVSEDVGMKSDSAGSSELVLLPVESPLKFLDLERVRWDDDRETSGALEDETNLGY